jgi:hypothetical protein
MHSAIVVIEIPETSYDASRWHAFIAGIDQVQRAGIPFQKQKVSRA